MQKSFHVIWIYLLTLCVLGCSKQIYTADIDTSYYRISKKNASDSELDQLIKPYRTQLDAKMNEVIAFNEKEMTKARPNSNLGNWFADVLLEEAVHVYDKDIDMAMQNYGGIRVPFLKQGDITVGNIYELMPFDNQLVILTMDGKLLQMLLDRVAEKGGWPISSTLRFTMNGSKAEQILIKGEPIDYTKKYTVALADYIANGGDNCFFLEQAEREDHDVLIRDLVIDHLKNKPQDAKRIRADESLRINNSKN
ncbi:MAG: 5'-nucleotidase [Saprospiraceae bacterium]|nr:5'-nucleotidase [Saprospiraceae bacterium]